MKTNILALALLLSGIIATAQINITTSVVNITCFGSSDGSACANASGGSGNYTYNWVVDTSFSSAGSCVSGLSVGVYTINVNDDLGATGSTTVVITEPSLLTMMVNVVKCDTGNTGIGELSALVAGGIPPYTYLWNTGATSSLESGLISGVYTVTATDVNGCSAVSVVSTNCSDSLVYPGDADYDLSANNFDLFSIGLAYGNTGPIRTGASLNWTGQYAANWGTYSTTGIDDKHSDCDGNGLVDAFDADAILLNYDSTHSAFKFGQSQYSSANPDLFVQFYTDTAYNNTTISLPVSLGTPSNPATNIYGVAFSLSYDPAIVDSNQVSFSIDSNSWMGIYGTDFIHISKNLPQLGQIDVAITRINHQSVSGDGSLGTFIFVLKDDILGKSLPTRTLYTNIFKTSVIDRLGADVPVNSIGDSIIVVQLGTAGIKQNYAKIQARIYPNPATEQLNISFENSSESNTIRLINAIGQTVYEKNHTDSNVSIDVSRINKGVYTLSITNSLGLSNTRISVTK